MAPFNTVDIKKPWALKRNDFERLCSIASEVKSFDELAEAPVETQSPYKVINEIAIIKVRGVLTKEYDMFSFLFNGMSVEFIMDQFRAAQDDEGIKGIVLDIDSPGGDVNGAPELAEMIYNSRGNKPVVSYVGYNGASAAYWIAAAADKIIIQEAAAVGSIGVYSTFWVGDEFEGEVTFVSSVSPMKILDPATDEGAARLQKEVDQIGDIFVDNVAKFRGVSRDVVLSDFGKGDIVISREAVKKGMADMVGNFDTALEMAENNNITGALAMTEKSAEMVDSEVIDLEWLKENKPELVEEIKEESTEEETTEEETTEEEAVETDDIDAEWLESNKPELFKEIQDSAEKAERGRIEEIEKIEKSSEDDSEGAKEIFKSAKFDKTVKPEEVAQKILNLQSEKKKKLKADRAKDAKGVPAVDNNAKTADSEDLVSHMRAGIKKGRR